MYVDHLCSAFSPSCSYSLTRGTYSDTNIPIPVPREDWVCSPLSKEQVAKQDHFCLRAEKATLHPIFSKASQ